MPLVEKLRLMFQPAAPAPAIHKAEPISKTPALQPEVPAWRSRLRFAHPERYTVNMPKYQARNGIINFDDDIARFDHNDLTRFYCFALILDQLVKEGVPGDFAELGVWKGNSAALLATMVRRLERTLYLLDTFEGFPNADLEVGESGLSGVFSDTSLEAVRALVGEERTVFIKGYFPETAAHIPEDAVFSLVHIDCDLEAPMRSALEFFYPRMSPGGFVLMHDYSSLHWDGAERAIDGFFKDKPESVVPLPDLGGSAMVRKDKFVTTG